MIGEKLTGEVKHLLKHLIYSSRPFGFDQNILNGILVTSVDNNKRDQITGALICRSDLYLQYLEGPRESIDETFNKIQHDDRHVEIKLLKEGMHAERLFPQWAMRDDPIRSWMWSREEVDAGALDRINALDAFNIFQRHSKELLNM
tara:strand:+ start:777 stop:1214 length:438 start_codon:yes stop_codon:yes gene_type:complete